MLVFGRVVVFGGGGSAFATAPLLGIGRRGSALKQRTETGVSLVRVRRAGAVAQRIADVAVRANGARELRGRRAARGGDEGQRKCPLTLSKAFGGVETRRRSGVRPGAVCGRTRSVPSGTDEGYAVPPALGLNGLYLVPFQLQEAFQILLQLSDRLRPGGPFAFRVEEDGKLSQAPRVERRRQEVRVSVAVVIIVLQHPGTGNVGMQVHGVDHLRTEVELRWSAGGGQDREPLGVRQVTGAVCVIFLVFHEAEGFQVKNLFLQRNRMQYWLRSQGQ